MITLPLCRATLAVLLLAAMATRPAGAIVGPAAQGSPVAASLVMVLNHRGGIAGFCTGLVVAPTVVITAAHCVPVGADLRVHLPDAGPEPALLAVADVARHPGYRPRAIKTRERTIDLALVHLRAPLPQSFSAARLGTIAGTALGARFAVSGYGVTREGDGASSGRLRTATLAARAPLSALLLWAEDPAKGSLGACSGDSGGAVVPDGDAAVSAVIVWSAGLGGRSCGSLTQALWLAPQRAWIEETARGWGRRGTIKPVSRSTTAEAAL